MAKDPWTTSEAIRAGSSSMLETAEWLLKRLPEMGIPVPAGSRLLLARKLISRVHDKSLVPSAADELLLRTIADAQRTLTEFYIILRAIRSRPAQVSDIVRAKLELMLGGRDVESYDRNLIHRNTQFELYVYALLIMGGATVSIAEPDLRFTYGSTDVGIAVKRLRSPKQLRKRAKEAAEQIGRSAVGGFIAVNYDVFTVGLSGPRESEDVQQRGQEFEAALQPVYESESDLADNAAVMGLMNFGYAAHWETDREPLRFSFGFFRQIRRFTVDQSEVELAEQYFRTLNARIENALRLL